MPDDDLSFYLTEISRVLIRVNNWIGDVVMSLPAFSVIRRTLPEASLIVLAKPSVAPLFEGNPDIDDVLVYDSGGRHAGLMGMGRLIRELRGRRFDLSILFQRAFEAAFLARASSIPIRAGYGTDGRRFLLTHPVPRPKTGPVLHRVEDDLRLLANLGFSMEGAGRPTLSTTAEEDEEALRRLTSLGAARKEPLVGFHPGAAYGAAKMWPAGRYASLARMLAERCGARVLLFGSAGESRITSTITDAAGAAVIDLVGRTSLREALALIRRCSLFVSNDSGLMHAAAALGIPVVAVFGPTNPSSTAPFTPLARVVRVPPDSRRQERLVVR
ncbi:lipopolysaccharide heptosyltransferase II, partial [Thermodesulfobacteriota bacterium]